MVGAAGLPSGHGQQISAYMLTVPDCRRWKLWGHQYPIPIFTRKAYARGLTHPKTPLPDYAGTRTIEGHLFIHGYHSFFGPCIYLVSGSSPLRFHNCLYPLIWDENGSLMVDGMTCTISPERRFSYGMIPDLPIHVD